MDFSTTFRESALSANFVDIDTNPTLLSAKQTNRIVERLIAIVDTTDLLDTYLAEIQQFLPIVNIHAQYQDQHYATCELSHCEPQHYFLDIPHVDLRSEGQLATRYVLSRPIDNRERFAIAELHRFFSRQFVNAVTFQMLKQLATKDMLTGLSNRASFDEASQRYVARFGRYENPFGLLVIDLDNFKSVNDTYGHQVGDKVLQKVADALRDGLRAGDEAFRFGGDEFCCLINYANGDKLSDVANRIRANIAACACLQEYGMSCSIGGALIKEGDNLASLFDRADKALYQVKASGKANFQTA